MKYKDEFQRGDLAGAVAEAIRKIPLEKPINLMEVCGTHTHAAARFGIRSMLPDNVNLLSGPGCPVCVTPNSYIDHALALASIPDVTITTFGDMFRVPGSYSSLQVEKGKGVDVRIVYSAYDALEYAKKNPVDRKIQLLTVRHLGNGGLIVFLPQSAETGQTLAVIDCRGAMGCRKRLHAGMKSIHINGLTRGRYHARLTD